MHTKGPWSVRVVDTDGQYAQVRVEPNIADVYYVNDVGTANARLIAAAPDLLAALRELIAWEPMVSGGDYAPAFERAREAIAAATGAALEAKEGRS